MTFNAAQQITVTSTEDEIVISTPKTLTLTLNGGGSYLKLSGEGVEHGSQGPMIMNVAQYLIPAGGSGLDVAEMYFAETEIAPVPEARKGLISR